MKVLPALRLNLKRFNLQLSRFINSNYFNSQSLLTSLSGVKEEKVPAVRKLIYAVGTLPYAFTLNIIGFYFTVFLLDVALVRSLIVQ